jgi:tetratricopeptide (TPR) repeat protein
MASSGSGIRSKGPANARIANRYLPRVVLGQGGMARVYRVTDERTGRDVALKQLIVGESVGQRATVARLFEREFHVLSLLQHPRVIAVYDYGLDGNSPFYTMELLDGGDLRDRAPLPWRELCAHAFDLCSSLALLHSRGLLHRDVSPRNVRCTRDGRAKLIDFGAMAPMGSGNGPVVGTPAFIAPETLQRSALDARTDLFSLGATMYFALCGSAPYAARDFADLHAAWMYRPLPPSARVPGIPPELDDLVLSLLNIEPGLRPASAFQVMQRLAAIAGLALSESESVSRAYLATPVLVARDASLAPLREQVVRARDYDGGGILVRAASGLGRSRLLDASAFDAKALGATVLRATANGSQERFAVAFALIQHLLVALPEAEVVAKFPELFDALPHQPGNDNAGHSGHVQFTLKPLSRLPADPDTLQRALGRLILTLSRKHVMLIAVDDAHRIDEPSAALLASLVDSVRHGKLSIVLTALADPPEPGAGLEVIARSCQQLGLEPLTRIETRQLLGSMFGEVENLELLTNEIYLIARGNPRHCVELAQHLVDQGTISYASGTWTLPGQLSTAQLPSSVEDAIRARIARLSMHARFLAEAQALAFFENFTHADYHALLPGVDSPVIETAISELLTQRAIVSCGESYTLGHRVWSESLLERLDASHAQRCHRALAELYERRSQAAWIHHLFAAGDDERGLAAVIDRQERWEGQNASASLDPSIAKLAPAYCKSIELAQRLGRSPREVHERRRWCAALSVAAGTEYFWQSTPAWLAQLKHDSGLDLWQADTESTTAHDRLMKALARANERYSATPEAERVYSVQDAIRRLAEYVVFAIAVGGRSMDSALVQSLPALLEPFAPLGPVLDAIWQNSVATVETTIRGQFERARVRWTEVHEKLGQVKTGELQHVDAIRAAVAYALGMLEAAFGCASAMTWAQYLDQDPYQRVSALYLRKVVQLEQGDWKGAERYGRQAELLALNSRSPQMFHFMIMIELDAHAHARDLGGVKAALDRLQPLAEEHPGWQPSLILAEARFDLIRGDYAAAREGFERCIAMTSQAGSGEPTMNRTCWIAAHAALGETLIALGQAEEARQRLIAAAATCEEAGIYLVGYDLLRALALVEAKLGEYACANVRLAELVERQKALGVTGLKLGLSYEALAQVAIWSGDRAAFDEYARLTAREYRHGAQCPLGARYESLINEALREGFAPVTGPIDDEPTTLVSSRNLPSDVHSAVFAALSQTREPEQRSQKALELVCRASGSERGHLYLVNPDRVMLAASQPAAPPPPELEQAVNTYLGNERERSEMLTTMATGAITDQAPDDCTVLLEGTAYELVLLRHLRDDVEQVTAIAAVVSRGPANRSPHRPQLLAAVAAQLTQAVDRVAQTRRA